MKMGCCTSVNITKIYYYMLYIFAASTGGTLNAIKILLTFYYYMLYYSKYKYIFSA